MQPVSEDAGMESVEDLRPSKKKVIYNEVMLAPSAWLLLTVSALYTSFDMP